MFSGKEEWTIPGVGELVLLEDSMEVHAPTKREARANFSNIFPISVFFP